jgi:hypothetical protein
MEKTKGSGGTDRYGYSLWGFNRSLAKLFVSKWTEKFGPPALGVGRFLTRIRHDWKNIPSLEPPPESSLCPSLVGFRFRSSQPESRARSGEANP